ILVMGTALAYCEIKKNILESDYLFYYKDVNNKYQLQLSDRVAFNHKVYMACGNQPILQLTCILDLSSQKYTFDHAFPSNRCDQNQITTVSDAPVLRGACETPNIMHHIGFTFQNQFIELYRTCFNDVLKTVKFTIHLISDSFHTATRSSQFRPDGVLTPAQFDVYRRDGVFACFQRELGNGQSYVQKSRCSIHRGHLVPNKDFPFHMQQDATFSSRNYVPQSQNRNQGSWKAVENWVRGLAKSNPNRILKVCTGTLNVLQLESTSNVMTEVFLWREPTALQIPIPKWMYKIVDYRYVSLTYNDQFSTTAPNPQMLNICNPDSCGGLELTNRPFTFCCNYQHFITSVVPYLYGLC
ncbi:hypothetical protein KR067_008368, partial [Drosophila pandora]